MTRTHIRLITLRKWFPPNDAVAASIARLCILREDFKLEMNGVIAGTLSKLDGNSVGWRKLYFIRNSIRTLVEIRSAIETLRRLQDFQILLRKQSKQDRADFTKFMKKMEANYRLIKDIRDALGGHVLYQSTTKALDTLDFDWEGLLEAGEITSDVHYKFAGELVLAILLPNISADRRMKELVSIIKTAADLTAALGIIDCVVWMYLRDRHLI